MNRILFKAFTLVNLLALTFVFAQTNSPETTTQENTIPSNGDKEQLVEGEVVNDNDKGSGRTAEIISTVEDVERAKAAYSVGKGGYKGAKNAGKYKDKYDNWDGGSPEIEVDIWDQAQKTYYQYKSSKDSFLKILAMISKKIAKGLAIAHKRVNMWRTTEGTLINYGKAMSRYANNTVEVFADFRPNDLWDIDRKWSRKMENQLKSDRRLIFSLQSFLDGRFKDLKKQDEILNKLIYDDHYDRSVVEDESAHLQHLMLAPQIHEYRLVPKVTAAYVNTSFLTIREIAGQAHGPSDEDPTMTKEQYKFDQIHDALIDKNVTYKDSKELSAQIASLRTSNQVQANELKQVQTQLNIRYNRLLIMKLERRQTTFKKVNSTLKAFAGGGPLPTAEEHRKVVFGEEAP